jgi:transcriptional regulator of heat shock response
MKTNSLTIKQEAFCQAYIRLGDKSAAYREAYSTGKMKSETVNRMAFELFNNHKITTRIDFLRGKIEQDNKATIGEIVNTLSDMLRFDVAELYDSNGNLKNIHSIPKKARLMIAQLETEEIKVKNESIGQTKKLKVFDKLQAVEKLMKHLGGYEKDNQQKAPLVKTKIIWNGKEIEV